MKRQEKNRQEQNKAEQTIRGLIPSLEQQALHGALITKSNCSVKSELRRLCGSRTNKINPYCWHPDFVAVRQMAGKTRESQLNPKGVSPRSVVNLLSESSSNV
jgi:hypothetical protein